MQKKSQLIDIRRYSVLRGIFRYFILILLIFYAAAAYAQKMDEPLGKKKDGIVYIPIIYYTPETKIAGGASVIYYYRNPNSSINSRPSTIQPLLIYTHNKQTISQITFDNYWRNGNYHSRLETTYKEYPDKFYGIGNDTPESIEEDYTSHITHLEMNFQKRLQHALYFGIQYEYQHNKIVEVAENGLLAKGDIFGSEGGLASGAGFLMSFDTRDNIFYPSSGVNYQLSANRFSNSLGSDFTFSRYTLDLRNYFSLFSSHVLALQGYMNILQGQVPFQLMSQVG
ncbi:MAG: BamA/TamA family outer membrane protein, partial [bacterium]